MQFAGNPPTAFAVAPRTLATPLTRKDLRDYDFDNDLLRGRLLPAARIIPSRSTSGIH